MNQRIFILTNSYPYGIYETAFLHNEISCIAAHFNEVFIIPLHPDSGPRSPLPENAFVLDIFKDYSYTNINSAVSIKHILPILFSDLAQNFFNYRFYKNIRHAISLLMRTYSKAKYLENYLASNNYSNPLFYSFWFDEWVTIASFFKRNFPAKLITRAHGYDLYEERNKNRYIPFRTFQLTHTDQVIAISRNGLNYLNKKYPGHSQKFTLNFLGTPEKGTNPAAKTTTVLTVVSCSRLVPLKRIHLLAESLNRVTVELKWVHFGGGEELERIKQICQTLPSNIKADLKGDVANTEIIDFYKNNYIDVFINVSETEGLPLSLMEAASFGIPMIATDVGGNSEIVTKTTGISLGPDFNLSELSDILNSFAKSELKEPGFRKGVKLFWEANFNSKKNSNALTQIFNQFTN